MKFCKTIYITTLIAVTATIAFVGCVKESYSPKVENPNKKNTETPSLSNMNSDLSSVISTTISKEELAKYGMKIEDDLSYMFSYLDIKKNDKIQIIDGKANIKIEKLPTGKTGTLSLEILKGEVQVLAGSKEDVTLQKGANSVELRLKPLNVTQPSDNADLTIDIVLDQGSTNLIAWDGKSFEGNDEFEIVVSSK